jgi:integrase/recombinase XerD
MDWKSLAKGFETYLTLEKGLSKNSIEAYTRDLSKLSDYFTNANPVKPLAVQYPDLAKFVQHCSETGILPRTRARLISGIKAFFLYLIMEDLRADNPAELLESPRLPQKLPDTLSKEEIDSILKSVDLSTPQGTRDRAILEVLYASGLRVSELTDLRISGIYEKEGFLRVIGKGNKERLVPIGKEALKHIKIYKEEVRVHQNVSKECSDILFLNRRGTGLSRVSIFNMVKNQVEKAGIRKTVSPHTFRHSFATHLVENGADLRAVQEMLGHESITTTEIYTHLDRSYLRDTLLMYHPRNN